MKTEKINFITIASSSNRKVSKEQEEFENKILTNLYKQYKNKPFEYARIDYLTDSEPNITTYPKNKLSIFAKLKNVFKNLIRK